MDSEAREQLALVYADEFGQLDWAVDQLEQLLRQSDQTEREVIRLLNLLASKQQQHGDLFAARRTYQRIVDRFPANPAAIRAADQIGSLNSRLTAQ